MTAGDTLHPVFPVVRADDDDHDDEDDDDEEREWSLSQDTGKED